MTGGPRSQRTVSFSNEDFPALPGAPSARPSQAITRPGLSNVTVGPPDKSYATKVGQNKQSAPFAQNPLSRTLNSAVLDSGNKNWPPIGPPIGGHSPAASKGTRLGTSPTSSLDASHSLPSSDRWGLLGLLSVIKTTNPDMQALALGTDLTTLGLNLNSPDALHSEFTSPFMDVGMLPGPAQDKSGLQSEYFVPPCYSIAISPAAFLQKVASFSEETLFYMFYAMPRDQMQQSAARELTNRNWRYHKEHKVWLTKDPANPEPSVKNAQFERGNFVFFDYVTWERVSRPFTLYYKHIEDPANGTSKQFGPSEQNRTSHTTAPTPTQGLNAVGSSISSSAPLGGLGSQFPSAQGPGLLDLTDPQLPRGLNLSQLPARLSQLTSMGSAGSSALGPTPTGQTFSHTQGAEPGLSDGFSLLSSQGGYNRQTLLQDGFQSSVSLTGQLSTPSMGVAPSSQQSFPQRLLQVHQQQQQQQPQQQQQQHTGPAPPFGLSFRGAATSHLPQHKATLSGLLQISQNHHTGGTTSLGE